MNNLWAEEYQKAVDFVNSEKQLEMNIAYREFSYYLKGLIPEDYLKLIFMEYFILERPLIGLDKPPIDVVIENSIHNTVDQTENLYVFIDKLDGIHWTILDFFSKQVYTVDKLLETIEEKLKQPTFTVARASHPNDGIISLNGIVYIMETEEIDLEIMIHISNIHPLFLYKPYENVKKLLSNQVSSMASAFREIYNSDYLILRNNEDSDILLKMEKNKLLFQVVPKITEQLDKGIDLFIGAFDDVGILTLPLEKIETIIMDNGNAELEKFEDLLYDPTIPPSLIRWLYENKKDKIEPLISSIEWYSELKLNGIEDLVHATKSLWFTGRRYPNLLIDGTEQIEDYTLFDDIYASSYSLYGTFALLYKGYFESYNS